MSLEIRVGFHEDYEKNEEEASYDEKISYVLTLIIAVTLGLVVFVAGNSLALRKTQVKEVLYFSNTPEQFGITNYPLKINN